MKDQDMSYKRHIRGAVNYFGNLGLFMLSWGVAIYLMSRTDVPEITCSNNIEANEKPKHLWTLLQLTAREISNGGVCLDDIVGVEPIFALVAAYSLRIYVNITAFASTEKSPNGPADSKAQERVYALLILLHLIMIGLLIVTIEDLPIVCVIGIQLFHSFLHILYWFKGYYSLGDGTLWVWKAVSGMWTMVCKILKENNNRFPLVVDVLFFLIPGGIFLLFFLKAEGHISFEDVITAIFHGVIIVFLCIVSEIVLTYKEIYLNSGDDGNG